MSSSSAYTPIEDQHSEMAVEVVRSTAAPSYKAKLALGATPQGPEHDAQKDRQHCTAALVVIGQAVAACARCRNWARQRRFSEYPGATHLMS